MPSNARELRRRARATAAPTEQPAPAPVRPEAGGGGGGEVAYMVLRSCDVDAQAMTAQKLRYKDPSNITLGDIEATGPVVTVYPAPGFFYDQFAPFVYPAGDEETYPLGTRVWAMRAMRMQGVWVIEPAFKMKANVPFVAANAVISPGSGG